MHGHTVSSVVRRRTDNMQNNRKRITLESESRDFSTFFRRIQHGASSLIRLIVVVRDDRNALQVFHYEIPLHCNSVATLGLGDLHVENISSAQNRL